jgi:integrase
MTVSEALTTYLALVSLRLTPATHYQYTKILEAFVRRHLGTERLLVDVTVDDLLRYATQRDIARASKRNRVAIIKAFFAWCVEMGHITTSPAQHIKFAPRSRDHTDSRAIPPDELRRVLDYLRYDSARNYALILTLATTAVRVGGLLSMRLPNLHVEHRLMWVLEKGQKWEAKYFGDETAAALTRWLSQRPAAPHDYVWSGQRPHYAPLTDNAVRYILARACEKTDCSRAWFPHSLRHAVAHAWADQGVPPTVVQAKLGHADPNITLATYYPHDDDRLRTTSQRLELQALQPSPHERFKPVPLPAAPPPSRRAASE